MSIRLQLTVMMLAIGLVPTILIGVIAYFTISGELTRKTENQLTQIATSQQQKINSLLQKKQEEVTKLANQLDLQSALGRYVGTGSATARRETYDILLNKKVATPDIQAIYLLGLDGTIISSTIANVQGTKLPDSDYFVPQGQENNISVKEDPRDGISKLYITTKVNVNKQAAGYLNLIFRIDDITAAVQDYTGLGATGETIIAARDSNGDAVSLFPLRFDTDAALRVKLNSLQLFTESGETPRLLTDYRGHRALIVARSIGFADWAIAVKMDLSETLGPIDQLRNSLIGIVVASSLAVIAFSIHFTRAFTKPILHIARVARGFGEGDFSHRVNFKRSDEIGALGNSIDTMGRSLQELVSSLAAQRNRLQIILNSTAESIMAIDGNGRILMANKAAKELAHMHGSLIGKQITEIFQWKRNMQLVSIDYAREGTNTYPDLQFLDAAGENHYVKIIVARLSGEREMQAPHAIITVHDQTKSRELENMKVDFVSMAAHELRTPLASTRGYLELIAYKESKNLSPDVRNYLQYALKSTSELGSLIDNLLGVTRIERGTLTLQPNPVDIAADIKQAVKDAGFSAADKNITLAYDGPDEGCMVIADQIALHEVINNLISNAIKYTNKGGKVTVSIKAEDTNYAVSVKDTGIGIPKSAMQHLFSKFYRVRGGLNSGSTGTGLGLFISKSIIERHGGTIRVESQEGAGSTFTFTLPALDESRLTSLKKISHPHNTDITTGENHGWVTKNIAR